MNLDENDKSTCYLDQDQIETLDGATGLDKIMSRYYGVKRSIEKNTDLNPDVRKELLTRLERVGRKASSFYGHEIDFTERVEREFDDVIKNIYNESLGNGPKLGGIAGFVVHHKIISAIIVIAIIVYFIFLKK